MICICSESPFYSTQNIGERPGHERFKVGNGNSLIFSDLGNGPLKNSRHDDSHGKCSAHVHESVSHGENLQGALIVQFAQEEHRDDDSDDHR